MRCCCLVWTHKSTTWLKDFCFHIRQQHLILGIWSYLVSIKKTILWYSFLGIYRDSVLLWTIFTTGSHPKKRVSIRKFSLSVGGGQFENVIFLKLKIRKFLQGGRGSESKCPYFLTQFLVVSWKFFLRKPSFLGRL